MQRVKLYSGTRNASSWAMRAWLALREAGVEFEEEVVDIRRPQRFANLARIAGFSPSATVPVLVTAEAVIFDSLAIMEYASDISGGRLLPTNIEQRAQARSLMAWQHAGLSQICARISFESAFYPSRRMLTPAESAEFGRLFHWLESLIDGSGGPYLFGPLSLADLVLVPTLVRLLAHHDDPGRWPRTHEWSQRLLTRPAVQQWMREAEALPHIWLDDYLVPGEPMRLNSSEQALPFRPISAARTPNDLAGTRLSPVNSQ